MKQLTIGGDEALKEMQHQQMWQSIISKHEQHREDSKKFMNSLTDDEYTEFFKNKSYEEFLKLFD